jgi:hypothetical protein
MIPTELQRFYTRWLQKAGEYKNNNLQDCFDKFFTLYVAFNRLYFELAIPYVKRGPVGTRRVAYISDSKAAKDYVQRYLGSKAISGALGSDSSCLEAVSSIINLLERKEFAIKLNGFGEGKPEADSNLLEGLKSNSAYKKIYAILDTIYSIRCNVFHGQKGYENVQIKILIPVTILLQKITGLLYDKMSKEAEYKWW